MNAGKRLVVLADGTPVGQATVERLVRDPARGNDTLENLALACAACNHEKGRRHDVRYGRTSGANGSAAPLRRPTLATGADDAGRGITAT